VDDARERVAVVAMQSWSVALEEKREAVGAVAAIVAEDIAGFPENRLQRHL
jgi:hypothetical protein